MYIIYVYFLKSNQLNFKNENNIIAYLYIYSHFNFD